MNWLKKLFSFFQTKQYWQPQWINVSDALPDLNRNVLLYSRLGTEIGCYKYCSLTNTYYFSIDGLQRDHVTHWMLLPLGPGDK